jgi:hypothetical protein
MKDVKVEPVKSNKEIQQYLESYAKILSRDIEKITMSIQIEGQCFPALHRLNRDVDQVKHLLRELNRSWNYDNGQHS